MLAVACDGAASGAAPSIVESLDRAARAALDDAAGDTTAGAGGGAADGAPPAHAHQLLVMVTSLLASLAARGGDDDGARVAKLRVHAVVDAAARAWLAPRLPVLLDAFGACAAAAGVELAPVRLVDARDTGDIGEEVDSYEYDNCEDFCESGSLDQTQCNAYDVCSWEDNQCWSAVGDDSCHVEYANGDHDSHGDHDSNRDHDSDGDHDSYGGWEEETLVGICSAAELPTLDPYSSEPVDWSGKTFTPNSDKEASKPFGELGLTTLKDLYALYDQDASDMTQGLVYAVASGCEAETQAFTMPPFEADVISSFFAHLFNSPVPGNDQINSIRKLTPFSGAKSKKDADGECKMIVALRDYPEVEGEIMQIDGVDFSCLQSAYEKVPDAYVALDAYTALARTTGSVPALGGNITVRIRDLVDDSVTDYSVKATFSNYASLKSKLDSRNDEVMWGWGSKPECGNMARMRWDGQVKPGDLACPRSTSAAVRPEDAREAAFESMVENKIGFASFGQSVAVKTGKKSEGMNNDNPPNFDPEKEGGTCKFSVYGLMDKNGDDVCAEPMNVTRARGHCSFDEFKKIADDVVSVIDRADKKITTSDSPDYLVHTGKDMWV